MEAQPEIGRVRRRGLQLGKDLPRHWQIPWQLGQGPSHALIIAQQDRRSMSCPHPGATPGVRKPCCGLSNKSQVLTEATETHYVIYPADEPAMANSTDARAVGASGDVLTIDLGMVRS